MDFSTDLEFAKAAYTTLKECDPERLHLLYLLLAEGETPDSIFQKMTEKKPEYTALPAICGAAAYWIVNQKNSN